MPLKCAAMTSGAAASNRNPRSPALRMFWLTLVKYSSIDGGQRAASFAYYAFFALFPLLLLLVAIGSAFFDAARVGNFVINGVSHYVLVVADDKHDMVRETIRGVIKTRRGVGIFAVLGLIWSSTRFFQSLVSGVNRAWGTHEYSWWRLPIQNLIMVGVLASALLVGLAVPPTLNWVELHFTIGRSVTLYGFTAIRLLLPSAVLLYSITLFYKLAPRRRTTIREIWLGSLMATVLLQVLQSLFLLYARNVAHFNRVYGAFGSVIAILMWVYLSGSVIILGGCFCAAKAEVEGKLENPVPPRLEEERSA
jgi:YihY family inner membrane protein